MKAGKKSGIVQAAIIGSIVVAAVLIIGTYWMGKSASRDTEKAVRNVSLLYLDELAGRREQVVASALDSYVSDLDVAIGLIDKEDLSGTESLKAYQVRMKQLYGLEKFAFVDEDGLIYTSRGTRTDIDTYQFDYQNLTGPDISVKNENEDDKKLVIATSVDRLPFEGKTLIVCFMEIDMDSFLANLSLQSDNNSTTFCNIYTKSGRALTNMVLGGLSSEDNLLEALDHAEYDEGYSHEAVRRDFEEGNEGIVSFTYGGISETLSYVPVHNTDWMLTYLIRESVISDQIGSISEGIIKRSVMQSVLTALALFMVFAFMIIQVRRATRLESERENSEAMQQELEERIALQDELLDQQKAKAEQDKMITALASDYRSVYYVDLDNDEAVCYRVDNKYNDDIKEGDHLAFKEAFSDYAERHVAPEYREAFLSFIDIENIRKELEKEIIISIRYLVNRDGRESYEMLRMAGVRHPGEREDGKIHAVGAGFTNIDSEMRDSMEKSRALSDALKTAEEASKAKTTFLSNMSHEIRTPMNAIIGLDSLALSEEDLSDSTRDYLEKIGSSAQHLLSLINDILDMSRIESGKMTLKNEEFSLSVLLEQINTMLSGQCREKGLEYNCRASESLGDYYIGDSTKLKQILINILSNAVKFTPEGGRVDFSVDKAADFGGRSALRFEIRDTGIGMSEEYLPKLYDVFSQESQTTVNKYGSSGLGMAITRNIVDMMNGKIEVESEKGKGTVFTVTVTLTNAEKKEETVTDESEKTDLKGRRILLAEDMSINAEIIRKILSLKEIETELAENGRIAVQKFEASELDYYDAIIMDVRMPEMDGLAATGVIRGMDRADAKIIPIIALTANAFDEDVQRSLQVGMNAHLSKPVEPDMLFETLENVIR